MLKNGKAWRKKSGGTDTIMDQTLFDGEKKRGGDTQRAKVLTDGPEDLCGGETADVQ